MWPGTSLSSEEFSSYWLCLLLWLNPEPWGYSKSRYHWEKETLVSIRWSQGNTSSFSDCFPGAQGSEGDCVKWWTGNCKLPPSRNGSGNVGLWTAGVKVIWLKMKAQVMKGREEGQRQHWGFSTVQPWLWVGSTKDSAIERMGPCKAEQPPSPCFACFLLSLLCPPLLLPIIVTNHDLFIKTQQGQQLRAEDSLYFISFNALKDPVGQALFLPSRVRRHMHAQGGWISQWPEDTCLVSGREVTALLSPCRTWALSHCILLHFPDKEFPQVQH